MLSVTDGTKQVVVIFTKRRARETFRYTLNRKPQGESMKITVGKNIVEFVPENTLETADLEKLWNTIVDCVKFNKKLVPIGEFVPQKSNLARFTIEDK
jgi:hypothetical protein